jgi:CspA family cold shock protein
VVDGQKGYGFLQPDQGSGRDVFVHISAVEQSGLSGPNEGQKVEYKGKDRQPERKTSAVSSRGLRQLHAEEGLPIRPELRWLYFDRLAPASEPRARVNIASALISIATGASCSGAGPSCFVSRERR